MSEISDETIRELSRKNIRFSEGVDCFIFDWADLLRFSRALLSQESSLSTGNEQSERGAWPESSYANGYGSGKEGESAASAVPAAWGQAAAEWLRNNYQDYDTIDALCDGMLEAAPQSAVSEWRGIETAPIVKGDCFWCRLAWGPNDDKSTGEGFRWGSKWFAAGAFYCMNRARKFEWREVEVTPTHWMPLPEAPK